MNQKDIPILEALQGHIAEYSSSFHVPGHKNGQLTMNQMPEDFRTFLQYDVTEISGLDDFHSPEGCILEAQKLLQDLYQTEKSYFLVNGSTVGNLAMVLTVCREGDVVFVQRNCHKSILNALHLAKLQPVFLEPELDKNLQVATGVCLETVKQAYDEYDNVAAIILTYPNYYGITYSLSEIIQYAKERGSFVLVDEAHGPHFLLGDPFPVSSLSLGADLAVQSAHKMLPAMTMGSYLHVNSPRVPKERLEFYLQALQSSSPSYPIMASLDMARAYLASITHDDMLLALQMRQQLSELFREKGIESYLPDDPLKLLLRKPGYTGFQLQECLEDTGIYIELADQLQVLCTLPLVKIENNNYVTEVKRKIEQLQFKQQLVINESESHPSIKKISTLTLTYEQQNIFPRKWINLEETVGQVSAETVIPYPPGIPFIMAGEIIESQHIKMLMNMLKNRVHIQGGKHLAQNKLAVFELK